MAAGLGLAVAAAGVTPGIRDLLADVVVRVPAAGVFRDGHKWIAPYAVLLAPAVALGVSRLADRARDPAMHALAAVGAVVVVLAVLPDLGWGAAGRLASVDYPREWQTVRAVVRADPKHGDVAVLPWGAFRSFAWNDRRTVLDPATRYLPGSVVASADLPVGRVVIAGDDPRAEAVRSALAGRDAAALSRLGVGWVLVEKRQAGERLAEPAGLVVHDGKELRLVQLSAARSRPLPSQAPLVVVVDVLVVLFVGICAAAVAVAPKSRRRRLPLVEFGPRRSVDRGSR